MHPPVRSRPVALLVPLAVALACGGGRTPAASSTAIPAPTPSATSDIVRIPDGNTAGILLASHAADLAAAAIATSRAQHRDVKLLARNIVTDHTAMSLRLTRLVEDIGLATRDDDISRLLRDGSAARRDSLRRLSGRQFDSAYVENEVRYHRDLLVAIDEVFLPSVRNARLKEHLAGIRPTIASHLGLARQVQAAIARRR